MEEAILNFPRQFNFKPDILRSEKLPRDYSAVIVLGMGGSHLAGGVIKAIDPGIPIFTYSDYGFPPWPQTLTHNALFVACSYSGNTEEIMSALGPVITGRHKVAVMTTGGYLAEEAENWQLPLVRMPDDGIQPRSALGYAVMGLLSIIGYDYLRSRLAALSDSLPVEECRREGEALAGRLRGKVPIIYSSEQYRAVAYNWKIKFNETGKIPAFYNTIPELNHNEMTGFDRVDKNRDLSELFHFIQLFQPDDHPQNIKRMKVTDRLYQERGLASEIITCSGSNDRAERIFRSLLMADWAAYTIAVENGSEPEQVPMVEEFKKLIS